MATRLIAHRLTTAQHVKAVTPFLRDALIKESTQSQSLIVELRKGMTRNSHPGKFGDVGGGKPVFQQRVEKYLSDLTDAEFIKMSRDLTQLLRTAMEEQVMSTGGFLVFAEHGLGDETLLLVALLSTEARTAFDEQMNPVESATLDFEHLRHGVRLRYSSIGGNLPGLLQFVAQRGEVADYFQKFIGCEKLPDTSEQGKNLINALQEVAEHQGADLKEVNMILHSYWQRCKKERRDLNLTALASEINPDDPESVLEIMGDEKYGLAGNFAPPPGKIMNRLIKFSYNEEGLKLELDKNRWTDKITITGKTLKIKQAPDTLIARIQEELLQ